MPDPAPPTTKLLARPRGMAAVRAQFFLSFAVLGCLIPYLSVFFKQSRGLTETQVGYVLGIAGVAQILTPAIVTLLADLRLDARLLMAMVFGSTAAMLLALSGTESFWGVLLTFTLFSLSFGPALALQDGINFAVQAQREHAGEPASPYHRVRVWGTLGFIAPSLVLFAWMHLGGGIQVIVWAAVGACLLGALNTLGLPDPHWRDLGDPEAALPDASRLPAAAAFRELIKPPVLTFCLAMFLLYLGAAGYYAFYPIYLTEVVGIGEKWIGLISTIGVTLEIAFMLGFGRIVGKLGLRGLMAAGAAGTLLRYALLAMFPIPAVAIGTQALHGLAVITIHVAPPVYLNTRAGPAFRHSIQGLYAMVVWGSARIVGNLLAGVIAEQSVTLLFAVTAGLAGVAMLLFGFAFRNPHG